MQIRRSNGETKCPWENLSSLASQLTDRRRSAELDLVGAVLADHPRLLRVASDVGIRRCHFENDDIEVIYLAAVVAFDQEIETVIRLAKSALHRANCWDDGQILGNFGSLLWSEATLKHLPNSWPASAPIVERLARKLIAIHDRQDYARTAYQACIDALMDTSETWVLGQITPAGERQAA